MITGREDYNKCLALIDSRGEDGIGETEPVFILRAQDENFIPMLEKYKELINDSVSDEDDADSEDGEDSDGMSEDDAEAFCENIDNLIALAVEWQEEFGNKVPDLPEDIEDETEVKAE